MGEWQPIESAPTDKPVQLGGWGPDRMRMGHFYEGTAPELVWGERPGIAFGLNERAVRVRKCDIWVQWWKPIDLTPPLPAPPAPKTEEVGNV